MKSELAKVPTFWMQSLIGSKGLIVPNRHVTINEIRRRLIERTRAFWGHSITLHTCACALHYPLHEDAQKFLCNHARELRQPLKICWIVKKLHPPKKRDEDPAWTRTFLSFFQGRKKSNPNSYWTSSQILQNSQYSIIWYSSKASLQRLFLWLSENFFF